MPKTLSDEESLPGDRPWPIHLRRSGHLPGSEPTYGVCGKEYRQHGDKQWDRFPPPGVVTALWTDFIVPLLAHDVLEYY
ncbi:hypothetical protein EYF80_063869 [Liparis tanakae]|uniref:Uncharacterized protein n=1 Tax=Liparis tanakae TaxID=230148 RepID=A0A4Z2EB73_9TELE|nr:hypothetical protein EYF80_063869 [Liparis tanakae]